MDRPAFRIGEVASGAGVSVDTVRYYERLKLLPRASRTSGNFRLFAPESIERVRFIKQAQELGLTLVESGSQYCRLIWRPRQRGHWREFLILEQVNTGIRSG